MTEHTIELKDVTLARLATLAESSGRPLNELIEEALDNLLEDADDIRAAEAVLDQRAAGDDATISLDAVSQRLGLDR